MKKIISVVVLSSLLVACGDSITTSNSSSTAPVKNTVVQEQKKLTACSVLNEDFIKAEFSDVTDIELEESSSSFPLCNAKFVSQGSPYAMHLTLGVIGVANEKKLDSSVSYFSKGLIESLDGVGEKAYLKTGMMGQISALSGGNLLHLGIYKNDTLDLELSMAKDLLNQIFKKLEN